MLDQGMRGRGNGLDWRSAMLLVQGGVGRNGKAD